jgi:hypothetical protein
MPVSLRLAVGTMQEEMSDDVVCHPHLDDRTIIHWRLSRWRLTLAAFPVAFLAATRTTFLPLPRAQLDLALR